MRLILVSICCVLLGNSSVAQASLSPTSQKVLEYTQQAIGKKIDRGECWDLANRALGYADADWSGAYEYGRLVAHSTIRAGDILQFYNVKIKYQRGNVFYTEQMKRHTAIVYKTLGKGELLIAHQNTSKHGRKVALDTLDLNNVSKGKIKAYRPQPK